MEIETQTKQQINLRLLNPEPIFVLFTYDGHGLPVAFRLQEEGYKVYVGQFYHLEGKGEEEKEKEQRMSLYDGLLDKKSGKELFNALLKVKNKDRYFIIFDFPFMWQYAEELRKAGFRGLLPHKEDWELEEDREKSQKLVEERYEIFSKKEHYEFQTIEEAKKFLEATDKCWVLKGNHPDAPTIVPISDEPEIAKLEIINALEMNKKLYEAEGFDLQEKLTDILEFTPEAISFNKIVRGMNIDIEIKNYAPGNRGYGGQTGATADVIFWLTKEEGERIYDAFLRPLEKEMLRENELTIWDAGTIYDKKKKGFFFTEYCIRPGYNALFTELSTLPSVGYYFEKLLRGEDIYDPKECKRFGASFRIFRVAVFGQPRDKIKSEDIILPEGFDKDIWLWDVKKTSKGLETANYDYNVAVVTGAGETLEEAFQKAFENTKKIVFNGFHWQLDMVLNRSYKNNIPERFEFVKEYFGLGNLNFSSNEEKSFSALDEFLLKLKKILEKE
jgi:phosphoribosylamine-glycine ligase